MTRRRHWPIWAAAALLLCGGGYLLSQRSNTAAPSGGKGGAGGRRGAGGPIPVAVAKVTRGNIGVYINALGTVTPVYTVTVTSRVVGELVSVHYREGQIVSKGQLLAEIDARPYQAVLMQAQGQLSRDQALLKNALIDLDRYRMIYSQHAIPEQTVATQETTVEQDRGTVQIDQGNFESAQVNVDYARIVSPINGRVGLRTVDPGNIVQANGSTGIATITQLQPITVIFTMAEDYIDEVASQMRAGHTLRVDALDRSDETELAQGTVLTVDNQIDTTTGTVRVRATFPNSDFKLFPNEFVNTRLLVKTLMDVNLIPTAAIQRNNDVAFVYVVTPNRTVQVRNIDIATTDGDIAAATGVNAGETLVTDGFDRLQDGSQISVRQGNPAAAASGKAQTQAKTDETQNPESSGEQGPAAGENQRPAPGNPGSPANNRPNHAQDQTGAANQNINPPRNNPQQTNPK